MSVQYHCTADRSINRSINSTQLSPHTSSCRSKTHLLPRQRVSFHSSQQVLRALGQRVPAPDVAHLVAALYKQDHDDDDDETLNVLSLTRELDAKDYGSDDSRRRHLGKVCLPT